LPQKWSARRGFSILETGFGTGLNFLAAVDMFRKTAPHNAVLDYMSIERYPLASAQIRAALQPWQSELGGLLEQMLAQYPMRVPGFNRVNLPRVRLTLIFDDVNEALPQVIAPRGIDAWFLDGFAPAKNPDMWSETLFREMKRLSAPGAGVATFTAAGLVRRGLAEAGFAVEKVNGFGHKRDMTIGRMPGDAADHAPRMKKIAVIGGGLAGTSCAAALKRQGMEPVIFETADRLASGASGNETGLYNPRFSAQRSADSDFYTAAFAQGIRRFGEGSGSLHLLTTEERIKKLSRTPAAWGWHESHMTLLSSAHASQVAGVTLGCDALFLPDAGTVSPMKLCTEYAEGCETRLSTAFEGGDWDAIILANGASAKSFVDWLPLHTVRGQITSVKASRESQGLACNLCYGGYISPAKDGMHALGATFQKWRDDTAADAADDAANLAQLHETVSSFKSVTEVMGHRAALRTAAQDRFPLIGAVPGTNFLNSAGHGSHGIISSLAGAALLADMIADAPRSLSRATVEALAPERFLRRGERRGFSAP
jgi:tRNA 5-methylaminomethyl-2-thiouridine biosynthesis bifunctional protein